MNQDFGGVPFYLLLVNIEAIAALFYLKDSCIVDIYADFKKLSPGSIYDTCNCYM